MPGCLLARANILLALRAIKKTRLVRDRTFDAALEVLIFLARRAADQADVLQVIARLEQVALLDLPHAVVLPRAYMFWIGCERAFVPVFRQLVVAKLARGIAEIVR